MAAEWTIDAQNKGENRTILVFFPGKCNVVGRNGFERFPNGKIDLRKKWIKLEDERTGERERERERRRRAALSVGRAKRGRERR